MKVISTHKNAMLLSCLTWIWFQIAIEGCAHGELDIIYATLQEMERVENIKIDLLLCCGDFQVRHTPSPQYLINNRQCEMNTILVKLQLRKNIRLWIHSINTTLVRQSHLFSPSLLEVIMKLAITWRNCEYNLLHLSCLHALMHNIFTGQMVGGFAQTYIIWVILVC